jgi:hypothetical protein
MAAARSRVWTEALSAAPLGSDLFSKSRLLGLRHGKSGRGQTDWLLNLTDIQGDCDEKGKIS